MCWIFHLGNGHRSWGSIFWLVVRVPRVEQTRFTLVHMPGTAMSHDLSGCPQYNLRCRVPFRSVPLRKKPFQTTLVSSSALLPPPKSSDGSLIHPTRSRSFSTSSARPCISGEPGPGITPTPSSRVREKGLVPGRRRLRGNGVETVWPSMSVYSIPEGNCHAQVPKRGVRVHGKAEPPKQK